MNCTRTSLHWILKWKCTCGMGLMQSMRLQHLVSTLHILTESSTYMETWRRSVSLFWYEIGLAKSGSVRYMNTNNSAYTCLYVHSCMLIVCCISTYCTDTNVHRRHPFASLEVVSRCECFKILPRCRLVLCLRCPPITPLQSRLPWTKYCAGPPGLGASCSRSLRSWLSLTQLMTGSRLNIKKSVVMFCERM